MSLEKLLENLNNLSEEKRIIYNKLDNKYHIAINGNGVIELVDISNFNTIARGEKKI